MSYNYSHTTVTVSERIGDLCYHFGATPSVENAQRILEKHLSVGVLDVDYTDWRHPVITIGARTTSPEHEGIDALVERLKITLFAYADKGEYTVTDEHEHERTVVVDY